MADYQTTAVQYEGMRQSEIREPVLRGVGHGPMGPAVDAYRSVADKLSAVGDVVAGALRSAAAAHSGTAADAAAQHVASMIEPGDTGWAQAQLAARALEDAADHHIRARQDMAAFPEPDFLTAGSERDRLHTSTILAGRRYQDNVNHGLTGSFQAFPPPASSEVGIGPATAMLALTGAGGFGHAGVGTPVAGAISTGAGTTAGVGAPGGAGVFGAPVPVGGVASPSGNLGAGSAVSLPAPAVTGPHAAGSAGSGASPMDAPSSAGAASGTSPRPASGTAPQALPRPVATGGPPSGWPAHPPDGVLGGRALPSATDSVISGGGAGGRWGSDQRGGTTWPGEPGWAAGAGTGGPGPTGSGASPTGRSPGFAEPSPRPQPGEPAAPVRPTSTARVPAGQPGYGGMPMVGGAGAGQDREHRRPSWLVEADPQALWLGNLPPHTDPVIGPDEGDR